MSAVALVFTDADSIGQLKSRLASTDTSDKHGMISLLENYLAAIKSGAHSATMQLTVRDTDPAVTTSGSGSAQYSF